VAALTARRFPPPWTVEEYNDACFIVRGNNGQQLTYIYFEDEPQRRSAAKNAHQGRGAADPSEYGVLKRH
jgi:hypothetical protein